MAFVVGLAGLGSRQGPPSLLARSLGAAQDCRSHAAPNVRGRPAVGVR
jgi:hypothetical protein